MSRAVDRAYGAIRSAIVSHRFPPEHRLLEEELAEFTGVSRTPVREALRRLHAEGFVELSPNRGARVVAWDYRDFAEVSGVRAVLEGYAARLAALRITDEALEAMHELAETMVRLRAEDRPHHEDTITDLNNTFHRLAVEAARNRRLVSVWESLVQVSLIQGTFRQYSEADMRRSLGHHRELVDALRARNPDWAESVIRSHHLAAQTAMVRRGTADGQAAPDGMAAAADGRAAAHVRPDSQ